MRQKVGFSLTELANDPLVERVVYVPSAKFRIAFHALYIDYALTHLQQGDVERTATEVEYEDSLVGVKMANTECEGSCRRLRDEHGYLQSCNGSCIESRLSCCILEICRNTDDGLADFSSDYSRSPFDHLLEKERRYLLRTHGVRSELKAEVCPHLPLHFLDIAILAVALSGCQIADYEVVLFFRPSHSGGHDRGSPEGKWAPDWSRFSVDERTQDRV